MGVSVENQDYTYRIEHLKSVPAAVRFLSMEPLLGPIDELNLNGIDWVIAGGESGRPARTVDPDWVRYIRDECISQHIPFFFKQWGGFNKKKNGKLLDGRIWNEMPTPKIRRSNLLN
jgi:protein gp37